MAFFLAPIVKAGGTWLISALTSKATIGTGAALGVISCMSDDGEINPPGPHGRSTQDASDNADQSDFPSVPDAFVSSDSVTADGSGETSEVDATNITPGFTAPEGSPLLFPVSNYTLTTGGTELTDLAPSHNGEQLVGASYNANTRTTTFWSVNPFDTTADATPLLDATQTRVEQLVANNATQLHVSGERFPNDTASGLNGFGHVSSNSNPDHFLFEFPYTNVNGTVYDSISGIPEGSIGQSVYLPEHVGGLAITNDGKLWIAAPGHYDRTITIEGESITETASRIGFVYAFDPSKTATDTIAEVLSATPIPRFGPTAVVTATRSGAEQVVVIATGAPDDNAADPWDSDGSLHLIDPLLNNVHENFAVLPGGTGSYAAVASHGALVVTGSDHSAAYLVNLDQEFTSEQEQLTTSGPLYSKAEIHPDADHAISGVEIAADGDLVFVADSHANTLSAWAVADGSFTSANAATGSATLGATGTDGLPLIRTALVAQKVGTEQVTQELVCAARATSVECFLVNREALSN